MKVVFILLFLLFISCSGQTLDNYKDEKPKLSLKSFFNGKIFAQGIVQDRSGKVIKRFDVDINASWSDNIGTLDEKFIYSDNTKGARIWKLTEISNDRFEGQAHDVIGKATGEVSGNAFLFEYYLDVPVGDSSYKIHFEDWMYLLSENTLMSKTIMTKWGIKVGEVTLVMIKKGER